MAKKKTSRNVSGTERQISYSSDRAKEAKKAINAQAEKNKKEEGDNGEESR
jgi:hypothetical protein